MKSMITIVREQISSFYLILRLSAFEMKSANTNNYLGQILGNLKSDDSTVHLLVSVRHRNSRRPKDYNGKWVQVPFFHLDGNGDDCLVFCESSYFASSRSIYSRIQLISKMSFPMSAIPSFVIMANFYTHLMLVAVVIVFLQFTDFKLSVYYIQLPYLCWQHYSSY